MDAGKTGRIHKAGFIVSTAVLFAVCWIAALTRAYIRIRIQKQVSWDDLLLALSLCFLTTGLIICYTITIDKMYPTLALEFGETDGLALPSNLLQVVFDYQKWVQVTMVLLWFAIMSAKFSFLALFKNLVGGIRVLNIYWWVTTIINVLVLVYGSLVVHISCPYYYSLEAARCLSKEGQQKAFAYLFIHLGLDLLGDLMILYIPVRLIWMVQVRWTQKLALTFSLCLTILMSIVTIIRGAGVYYKGLLDTGWEAYWVIICAEIGIILAAGTAFRTLFVVRKEYRIMPPTRGFQAPWAHRSHYIIRRQVVAEELPERVPQQKAKGTLPRQSKQFDLESSETGGSLSTQLTALPRIPSTYLATEPESTQSPQSSVFILN